MATEGGEYHFSPHVVWVEPGGSVTFVDESGHYSATAYHADNDSPTRMPDDAESWDSGLLGAGEEFERSFDVEGVYDYYCRPHESEGMLGSVIVGRPDPDSDPGLAAPGEEFDDHVAEKVASLNKTARSTLEGHEQH
jgi:plastocyanin